MAATISSHRHFLVGYLWMFIAPCFNLRFLSFDIPEFVEQVLKQLPVVNPVKERISRFLNAPSERNRFAVYRVLKELTVCQQSLFFMTHFIQKLFDVILSIVVGEISEVVLTQAEQNTSHLFS